MPNPRLAGRYAKSLIDLATEQNQVQEVYNDMVFLQSACKSSREFVTLLKSPVINADKKENILKEVCKGRVGKLTGEFNRLLIVKGRESILPEIVTAFIEQYNQISGIHTVKLTTAQPASDELKNAILAKLKAETSLQKIELQTETKEELIGGFVLEFGDKLVDASVLRDLKDIQKQFTENIYIQNIR